ncbi:homocysteine S-methyltransferase [Escherichia coli]|uniref:Homocysteine S-methyltransferase n=19 Tax=Enterobacterales TaxID=91347 RepID=A0A377BFD2_ECOLX|nr:homocysteine S-methyltransferase [Escherichia coli]
MILTAILSAANSGLYASGRMLWSLSNERTLPACFARVTKNGVPLTALSVSMLGGVLALFSSVVAPDTVFVALSAISGFAVVAVWLSICASHFVFRRRHLQQGKALSELHYRAPWYPLVPVLGLCCAWWPVLGWHSIQRRELRCGAGYRLLRCAMVLISLLNPETQNRSQNMSQNNPLRALLDKQDILLLDGAMATELEARGCNLADSLWSAKVLVENPELIREVHLDYYRAGAQCAITASYQATPAGFAARGLDEAQSKALIGKSVELARKAREAYLAENPQAGTLLVAGSVGPYGAYLADGSEYRGDYHCSVEAFQAFHRPRVEACWMPGPICWPAKPCRIFPRLRRWPSC